MKPMKALQILAPGRAELIELPVPQPGPGEVLVKVLAVTTCPQWDMHVYAGEPMWPGEPLVYPYQPGQPGHELCGEVTALGEGVSEFAVGQRICAWRGRSHDLPGGYAQFIVQDATDLISAPAQLEPMALAALELAMCVSSSFLRLQELGAVAGKRFGVMGLGPAGLVAVQLARAQGAREVVGFDLNPARRELASALGADHVLDPGDEVVPELPLRWQEGSLDSGIDCVGLKQSVAYLMDHTSGVVALFGVQREDYAYTGLHNGAPGLLLCGYPGHRRSAGEYALEQICAGRLSLSPLVTHCLPLAEYEQAVGLLCRQEAVKVCFDPWQ